MRVKLIMAYLSKVAPVPQVLFATPPRLVVLLFWRSPSLLATHWALESKNRTVVFAPARLVEQDLTV